MVLSKRLLSLKIFIFLLGLSSLEGQLKYNYTWILGMQEKINTASIIRFSDTGIVSMDYSTSRMQLDGDGSIICDRTGDLKLVFKNCFALNSKLDTILRSIDLNTKTGTLGYCKNGGGQYPFDQSTIILPYSKDSNRYHLIFVDAGFISESFDTLKGSYFGRLFTQTVSFSRDNRGEILGSRVEVIQDSITPGMITACAKRSSNDWWIIARLDGTPCYALISLEEDTFYFVKKMCFGSDLTGRHDLSGCSEFSPNRKHYAHYLAGNGLYVFDFNDRTGELSNYRKIDKYGIKNFYGKICFSPDSRFLYLFTVGQIIQFDLLISNVNESAIVIDSFKFDPVNENYANYFSGKIGPDGRIYVGGLGAHKYLSVIHRPNCRGLECDFRKQSIELPSRNFWGLPDSPQFNVNVPSASCPSSLVVDSDLWGGIEYRYFVAEEKLLLNNFNSNIRSGLVRLVDLNGVVMASSIFKYGSNIISMDQFPSSVYFIYLQIGSKSSYIGKIIKY